MLSRMMLPAYQFAKCLAQQASKTFREISTAPNAKFRPSGGLHKQQYLIPMVGIEDLRLLRRYRTNESVETRSNMIDGTETLRLLAFLKTTEITKLLTEARREITTPISKITAPETDPLPPEDVESDLYDVQNTMEPEYREVLYQELSRRIDVPAQEYDNSGPVSWQIIY